MAQNIDRSKAPSPGKAPIIQVGNPVKFTLANGLQVFVVKNTKLPKVSATLALDYDGFVEGFVSAAEAIKVGDGMDGLHLYRGQACRCTRDVRLDRGTVRPALAGSITCAIITIPAFVQMVLLD